MVRALVCGTGSNLTGYKAIASYVHTIHVSKTLALYIKLATHLFVYASDIGYLAIGDFLTGVECIL